MERDRKIMRGESDILSYSPMVLVQDALRRWLLILLIALVVGIGSYIVKDISYQPVYHSNVTFVLTSRGTGSSVYSNLSSTNSLATVFSELMNSSVLREKILAEIEKPSFDGTIQANVISETNLVTVSVAANDPRTAFQVAQAIVNHHEIVTYQVLDDVTMEVLQKPKVPVSPSNYADSMRTMKRMTVAGALGAFFVLIVLAYFRNVIRSSKEAQKKLKCECLGEIPHEEKYKTLFAKIRRRKTSVLITNSTSSFHFVETVRKLQRRIQHRMHNRKVLMVTSVLENEGKSTVSVNLALAMAQKNAKVLLIDCDLRKPACHIILEQKHIEHGLRDVLTGRVEASEAILHSDFEHLDLLLQNTPFRSSADLLTSKYMQKLLMDARELYDYVILDLPPMGAVSDAESLVEYVDASILVVCQNTATVDAIHKAVDALDKKKAKMLGCVLNNVYTSNVSGGYGYGRYGKYGHYGRYGAYDSRKVKGE